MEVVLAVAFLTWVLKNGVVDVLYAMAGKTSPRRAAVKARMPSGAATRFFGELWNDTWDGASKKRAARKAGQSSSQVPRPRGAATQFFAGLGQDAARGIRRSWDKGWVRADERRRAKVTRPRPGQVTVPGQVIPNAPSRPEDEDEDDAPVPQDEPTDPGRQDDSSVPDNAPDSGPDNQTSTPLASTTTQEGTTMTTTMPTGTEVVSLNKAIEYSELTARVAKEMVNSIDFTVASLATGGVTGIAVAEFTSAKEAFGSIDVAMTRAAAEFHKQLAIQEAFIANPGAGSKEFIMGGR